jgi:hypothetical protein
MIDAEPELSDEYEVFISISRFEVSMNVHEYHLECLRSFFELLRIKMAGFTFRDELERCRAEPIGPA